MQSKPSVIWLGHFETPSIKKVNFLVRSFIWIVMLICVTAGRYYRRAVAQYGSLRLQSISTKFPSVTGVTINIQIGYCPVNSKMLLKYGIDTKYGNSVETRRHFLFELPISFTLQSLGT
jgi:hypothetical protein